MKMIKKISDDMWENIHEAKEKIREAYKLRDHDKGVADWYKEMAEAHMKFNVNGHANVKRLIDSAKIDLKDNPMVPGMLAVYNEMHADIMAEAAEVSAMISAYK